jgi:hypothetical protein
MLAEQNSTWVPETIALLDLLYEQPMNRPARAEVPLDRELWSAIGVDNILWGSDYPNYEGTWPHSPRSLAATFGDAPRQTGESIVGVNAARLYGFDVKRLAPIAAEVGPELWQSRESQAVVSHASEEQQ